MGRCPSPLASQVRRKRKRRRRVLQSPERRAARSGRWPQPSPLTRSVIRIMCSVINWRASLPCLTFRIKIRDFSDPPSREHAWVGAERSRTARL